MSANDCSRAPPNATTESGANLRAVSPHDLQVGPGAQGVGVLGAEEALAVGQDLLAEGEGLGDTPRRPVGPGQVAPGPQGVGVLGAEEALAVGDETFPQGGASVVVSTMDEEQQAAPERGKDPRGDLTIHDSSGIEVPDGFLDGGVPACGGVGDERPPSSACSWVIVTRVN